MSLEDKSVCVVCDDTDVFVLLVHFYNRMCLDQAPGIMASPVLDRAVTDIHSTAGADPGFEKRRGRSWIRGEFWGIFRPI